jgi:TonB family protein
VKSKLVMPDIERLPPTLEAVVEVRATASGSVLSRRLIKPSGNSAWDNAVLRAIEAASPLATRQGRPRADLRSRSPSSRPIDQPGGPA